MNVRRGFSQSFVYLCWFLFDLRVHILTIFKKSMSRSISVCPLITSSFPHHDRFLFFSTSLNRLNTCHASFHTQEIQQKYSVSIYVSIYYYRPLPLFFVSPQMSSFSTRALTLLSSVFGACGLLLVGVAVSTDYWLLMEEGIVLQQNQTTEVKMALHSGLWRVCFVAGW